MSTKIFRAARIAAASVLLAAMAASPAHGIAQQTQAATGDATAALLADYTWRSIGPAAAGGRIAAVDAMESDFRHVVVGVASGGVWKSDNAGTTWTPIFDDYGSSSIGDVKFFQGNRDIIWVGTGEGNNRNSVAWGDGVYRSTDGGETFVNVGLGNTFQIARLVTHPSDPDVAYVAAVGQLWGESGERGLYKTSDGARTWQKLTNGLPTDPNTGATEIVMDPSDPDVLYTAFYKRIRLPWRLESGSTTGGIFKSTDGGRSWRKLTNGLPTGWTGRIGISVYRQNPQIVMAIVEAAQTGDLSTPGSGVYRSEDGGETWAYLNPYNNRPFYYSQIRINPQDDKRVYVLTANFMASSDGGRTFSNPGMPFGGAYDYHDMWIDPNDGDRYYLGKDKGLTFTHDHGASFVYYDNLPIMQAYHVTFDMRDPYAVYAGLQDNGTWGTMSFTRDVLGIRNDFAWKMHWDDGMFIVVDPRDWRTIYSEGTNASFRRIDPIGRTDEVRRVAPARITNWDEVATETGPGDPPPFRVNWTSPFIMSPHNPDVLYYGANHLLKSTNGGVSWTAISRDLSNGDPGNRRITPQTSQVGGESGGAEQHANIFAIAESPVAMGTIWVGTNDGNVWLTRDDGASWTRVDSNVPDVPRGLLVSRIVASSTDANTAYLSFDGHRSDNRDPWLFRTRDGGRTWENLSAGLRKESPVYVVAEDSRNPDLLFVGTEHGVQVSFDRGTTWRPFMNGLPTVAVYDLNVHPRDRDLIIGTHGRGVYILDDITALEEWRPALANAPVHLFPQRVATRWVDMSRTGQMGDNLYGGENPPSVARQGLQGRDRARIVNTPLITYYMGPSAAGTATLEITGPDGETRSVSVPAKPGITRFAWDLRAGAGGAPGVAGGPGGPGGPRGGAGGSRGAADALPTGVYQLRLTVGGATASGTLVVRPDPILAP